LHLVGILFPQRTLSDNRQLTAVKKLDNAVTLNLRFCFAERPLQEAVGCESRKSYTLS